MKSNRRSLSHIVCGCTKNSSHHQLVLHRCSKSHVGIAGRHCALLNLGKIGVFLFVYLWNAFLIKHCAQGWVQPRPAQDDTTCTLGSLVQPLSKGHGCARDAHKDAGTALMGKTLLLNTTLDPGLGFPLISQLRESRRNCSSQEEITTLFRRSQDPIWCSSRQLPTSWEVLLCSFLHAVHCNASFPSNASISVCKRTRGMQEDQSISLEMLRAFHLPV